MLLQQALKHFTFMILITTTWNYLFPQRERKGEMAKRTGDKIFLGIDHTAIGVSNTDSSLQYWVNNLSLEKKGESHNTGTEQAHLNFVKNAELHITGLAAAEGPGVEFLQYLKPGAGKIYPADTQCDDLWNWLTKVYCTDIDALHKKLIAANMKIVSDEITIINGKKNFIARDPDGHAVWFIEN